MKWLLWRAFCSKHVEQQDFFRLLEKHMSVLTDRHSCVYNSRKRKVGNKEAGNTERNHRLYEKYPKQSLSDRRLYDQYRKVWSVEISFYVLPRITVSACLSSQQYWPQLSRNMHTLSNFISSSEKLHICAAAYVTGNSSISRDFDIYSRHQANQSNNKIS